jgi:hypothetical protein
VIAFREQNSKGLSPTDMAVPNRKKIPGHHLKTISGNKQKVSKAQKQKAKHSNLLEKIGKQKEQQELQKQPKSPFDLSSLDVSLFDNKSTHENVNKVDKNTNRVNGKRDGTSISTKGKKYLLEREKKRFNRIISDPIFKADPINAVLTYLEHCKQSTF